MNAARHGYLALVGSNDERAASIKQRKEAFGIPDAELARMARVSRGVVHRAMHGETVLSANLGAMEAALDRFDEETGELRDLVATIELPGGIRATFTGSPIGVAESAEKFLAKWKRENFTPEGDPGSAE